MSPVSLHYTRPETRHLTVVNQAMSKSRPNKGAESRRLEDSPATNAAVVNFVNVLTPTVILLAVSTGCNSTILPRADFNDRKNMPKPNKLADNGLRTVILLAVSTGCNSTILPRADFNDRKNISQDSANRRMYRVCQEFSGFIGTARLCPHSFSPPRLITPLNLRREELVTITVVTIEALRCDPGLHRWKEVVVAWCQIYTQSKRFGLCLVLSNTSQSKSSKTDECMGTCIVVEKQDF
ncbi:hypothetical protein J6590_001249 [Homalodisca vitripennis]|nr:hypothetical protein J6590_001249 [Homalodisca vitripennis]